MWELFRSKPACPVYAEQQRWVDGRFRWLQDQFGHDTPRKARVVLPTPEFFPDSYDGKPDDAYTMFNRVAGYMNVDVSRFNMFIYSESDKVPAEKPGHRFTSGSAGVYIRGGKDHSDGATRATVGIEATQLADPLALVATLAHEIAHELLLGENRITPEQADHEPLTDLLTVFLGMGIFTANSTIRDRAWSDGMWTGWQTKRLGYLDQRMFGYSLARFAWSREESRPPWVKHVRPDVRTSLKQGLRFLAHQ